jgi:carotenoid cleavage dioxygenase
MDDANKETSAGDTQTMTRPFPDTTWFTGYNEPFRMECDVFDLVTHGAIPPELNGTWYRCGPDTQYPPHLGDDIYVNGDGMISMFRIENGHVDFKMRYVRTERWKAERAARRSLYGKYRNPYTDSAEVRGKDRGTANTTPVWHGGRLLVLKEDHVPMQVDPDTLETIGPFTWNGKLRSKTVTAHPKIDPVTGEMIMFGYEVEGDGSTPMMVTTEDRDGNLTREDWFEPPYVGMVHDFAITEDYILFPVMPTTMVPERLAAGGDHWMWDGSLPSWMGVLPRRGDISELRWFKMPTMFAFHTMNAFNQGPIVHIDMMVSKRCAFPFIADVTGAPVDPSEGAPFPTRWTFDMNSNAEDGGFTSRLLAPFPGELPLIDTRRTGRPYRYGYVAVIDPSHRMLPEGPIGVGANAIGKLDLQEGSMTAYHGAEETAYQEGFFVPRGPGEDEGWYINVADHHDQNRSDLLVFDAQHIEAGPVAVARLPIRLRNAFHTTWAPASAR